MLATEIDHSPNATKSWHNGIAVKIVRDRVD
jgi:hypothetical protein